MTGKDLRAIRTTALLTQTEAAAKLEITQAYLSLLETGTRAVSVIVANRASRVFRVPATAIPLGQYQPAKHDEFFFQKALGRLGYPGFAYFTGSPKANPAKLLMQALDSQNLDSRVTEALPWLPAKYPQMDWAWLALNARIHDRQNRLAFIAFLGAEVASKKGDVAVMECLSEVGASMERSRLAAEDTLCKDCMTKAERKWLRSHRSPLAEHWNLLTDLSVEQMDHGFH